MLATPEAAFQTSLQLQSEQSGRMLDASHAKAVRLLWCDTAGIRRCRVVSGRRYGALHTCGLGITTACMAMPAYADSTAPNSGLSAVGEARMKPVDSTRVALPWSPGHQIALVEFEAPSGGGRPWDCCPRHALRNTCQMLRDNFGLGMKVGFEIEFLLLERCTRPDGSTPNTDCTQPGRGLLGTDWQPVDAARYCQSSALDRQARVLDQMVDALEAMGVEVVQWHAESAPGQYEIALMYSDPVDAADKLLLAKEALVGVAGSHGLAVSFLPKPFLEFAGNGLHVHFSLWKEDDRGFTSSGLEAAAAALIAAATAGAVPQQPRQMLGEVAPNPNPTTAASSSGPDGPGGGGKEDGGGGGGSSREASVQPPAPPPPASAPPPLPPQTTASLETLSFLAGVLSYMDVLLPFTASSPNSYDRLRPGAWAGAHAAWGYNNREVPLRVTGPGGPGQLLDGMHVEYKALDGTANPYLALSAIIVAGMLGLSAKLLPPEPCQVPPAELDAEAADRLGVRRLPESLRAAMDALQSTRKGDTFRTAMTEAIGQPLLQAFMAVRNAEVEQAPRDRPQDMLLRYS